jgi:hypothetical protein
MTRPETRTEKHHRKINELISTGHYTAAHAYLAAALRAGIESAVADTSATPTERAHQVLGWMCSEAGVPVRELAALRTGVVK